VVSASASVADAVEGEALGVAVAVVEASFGW
jgi:hypothetical protein